MNAVKILQAPDRFDGSLQEFYEVWAKHVLLGFSTINEFHHRFCEYYLGNENPIHLVRMVKGMERGQTLKNRHGHLLRATDNAPAWWIHYQLFNHKNQRILDSSTFFKSIPCHMFQVRLPQNINTAGWHVAHIYDAKDGRTDFENWDKKELLRRTARNIHPCNYFYIPKIDWQSRGGDPCFIAHFYEEF